MERFYSNLGSFVNIIAAFCLSSFSIFITQTGLLYYYQYSDRYIEFRQS